MRLKQKKQMALHAGFLILLAAIICSGCRPVESTATPTALTSSSSATPTVTNTATPGAPVVLWSGSDGFDQSSRQAVEELLQQLSEENGFVLEQIAGSLEAAITPRSRLVFLLKPEGQIGELANEFPEIGFVTVGDVQGDFTNVYQVKPPREQYDQSGFIAGYIAAIVTDDYRIGGIAVEASGQENAALEAFRNGVIFYCGLCRPGYPPFNSYPQAVRVSSAEPGDVLAAVEFLKNQGVTTIYLSPGLSNDEIIDALDLSGMRYIGYSVPEDHAGDGWIASVRPDIIAGIKLSLEAWEGSEASSVIESPIALFDVNPELLTPGRLAHIQSVIEDLSSNLIDTGVNPLTGEPR